MKSKSDLLILLLFFSSIIWAAKVVPLPNLIDPGSIVVDKDRIYITEKTAVCIYSLKDFKLIKKFGREGEGPQEFKVTRNNGIRIDVLPDYILVGSVGKLSYFTRDGEYKKEIKTGSEISWFKPLGNGFVGHKLEQEGDTIYNTINIYDANVKKIKEIYRQKFSFQLGKGVDPVDKGAPLFYITNNKILVDDDKGVINVFDSSGNKLYGISHSYEKIKITKADEKRYHDFFRTDPGRKQLYGFLKNLMKFPTYFPSIRRYHVENQKVYVVTYKEENGKRELLIFDLKGKLLKQLMVPLAEKHVRDLFPYTTYKGTLYQLIENENTEVIELHITKIE